MYFVLLKRKVVLDRVLGVCGVDGFLVGDLVEIRDMFNSHFENILLCILLTYEVVATRDACCRIFPRKSPMVIEIG